MSERNPPQFTVRGRILLGDSLKPTAVSVRHGRIIAVQHESSEAVSGPILEAPIVSPGFIDLQVNGGYGGDVGENPQTIRVLAERLPETGVTAFLPTVISSRTERYEELFDAFATLQDVPGARPLGLHLEGPLLSPQRPGAHDREVIEQADPALLTRFIESEGVRLVTVAPERPGVAECIPRLVERGIAVSLGHTDASAAEFAHGIDAGAAMVTHLYNAMSAFDHRAPNTVGVALIDCRVVVGIIPDGVHVHPIGLRLAVLAKGTEGIALVTDMMAATGMPPGEYPLGGRKVQVDGTSARLADGTLAGSILTLDAGVRNMVRWAGVTPAQALRMATEVPAGLLGLKSLGRIAVGMEADLVLLDDNLEVQATIIRGEWAYRRSGWSANSADG